MLRVLTVSSFVYNNEELLIMFTKHRLRPVYCSVYLCNSYNVDSYKAVNVVFFLNIEEIESQYTDSTKFNIQLRLVHGNQLSF